MEKPKEPFDKLTTDNNQNSIIDVEEVVKANKKNSWWWELTKFILIAAFIILPLRLWVIQPFIVQGGSMENNFDTGQYLLVDELSYHFKDPARGDVLIFKYPIDPKKYFIKRVIGLPNETIEIKKDVIFITLANSTTSIKIDEPYLSPELSKMGQQYCNMGNSKIANPFSNYGNPCTETGQKFILKADEFLVLGDNRKESMDSRFWGPLERQYVIGRPLLRLVKIVPLGNGNYFPLRLVGLGQIGPFPGAATSYYQLTK